MKRARLMLAKLGGASVAALSLLGLPAAAHAQAGKLPVHVTGGADCGLWSVARQQHGSDILEQYVVGMLDGLSSGADREFWQACARNSLAGLARKSLSRRPRSMPLPGLGLGRACWR